MNAPVFTQENLLVTVTTPLGDNKLLFKSLQGEEQLSNLFQFHSWLWLLTLTTNCRIFQQLTVPEIIKKVFTDLGFSDYRLSLFYRYEQREYCVQYEETAFNFVSRLMEDEGLFYFFEHHEDKHVLVIGDDLGEHQPCPGIPTARFLQVINDTQPENAVTECYFSQQLTTGKYAVDDFNFETPARDLKTSIDSETHPFRVYEYGAGFSNRDQGEHKVRCRLEGCTTAQQLLEGQGHCFSFIAGYQFTLTNHPRRDFNQEYVLRWLSHSLSLTHYSNAFHAVPATVAFRPAVVTPKPRIVSTQTAIVTGPGGEEIWTDKYGRIKVQFHWDQDGQYDENSSCWVRVNQSWAGKGWGGIWIPRIGQEVIISFINGDPDRPLVTGAVYNAQQTVPYSLPADQTKSTIKSNSSKGGGGYNEFRFEDKIGQEEVYLQGQKDWNILIKHDKGQTVGHDETLSVGNNRTKTVGVDQSETIGSNKTIKVGSNHTETIGANMTLQVIANHTETIGGNMTLTVSQNKVETIAIASAETIGAAKALTIGGAYQISVGAAMNETVALVKAVEVGVSSTETVGGPHTTKAKTVLVEAEEEIVLKAGGVSITLKKSGDIVIKGSGKMLIQAAQDMVLKVQKIAEN